MVQRVNPWPAVPGLQPAVAVSRPIAPWPAEPWPAEPVPGAERGEVAAVTGLPWQ